MSKEQRDYFFEALNSYLRQGFAGPSALRRTATNYAHVFFGDESKSPLAKAAGIALEELGEFEKIDSKDEVECICAEWEASIGELLMVGIRLTREMPYKGAIMRFCPWCGKKLITVQLKED